jgi:MATE family multidrug resistance protein
VALAVSGLDLHGIILFARFREKDYSAMSGSAVQPEVRRETETGGRMRAFRRELGPTLALALPVIVAEVGWMGMGLADMLMVGPLGAEAIGAVGLGNILYFAVAIFGYGLLTGMDTEVSQAFGARRIVDCHRVLVQGIILASGVTPVLTALVWIGLPWLGALGLEAGILRPIVPYLKALTWGTLPLLLFTVLRRYLQGMSQVRAATIALVSANVVNVAGNWLLVYGHWGFPALGVVGSGWATTLARVYLLAYLVVAVVHHDWRHATGLVRTRLRLEWVRLRRLIELGLPAAIQYTLEIGVFAVAASLAGRLGASALAAHEIALNVCSFTFMVPFGISSAGSVRVGQAIGRRDVRAAIRAGWTALAVGVAFMAGAATSFLVIPQTIVGMYTDDPHVLATGITLLAAAAAFQLFDGIQVVSTGNLRGIGDTRAPMYANLLAHWGVGLPIGYVLGFLRGWGILGLWIGLSTGLIVVGGLLLGVWSTRARKLGTEREPELSP